MILPNDCVARRAALGCRRVSRHPDPAGPGPEVQDKPARLRTEFAHLLRLYNAAGVSRDRLPPAIATHEHIGEAFLTTGPPQH